MAVIIRLARHGAKKRPYYRIVVADSRYPTDGRIIALVGTYDPKTDPPKVQIERQKLDRWLERGAKPTDTVRTLLKRAPVAPAEPAVTPAT